MSVKGDNQFGYLWIKQASSFLFPLLLPMLSSLSADDILNCNTLLKEGILQKLNFYFYFCISYVTLSEHTIVWTKSFTHVK